MITVQSWIQDLWTIYERKKENISQSDNAYRHNILSAQGTITGIPELICSQNLAKKTKLTQEKTKPYNGL